MEGKKKSGNDYLKEKIAKLEADKAQLNGVIEKQKTRISELAAELVRADAKYKEGVNKFGEVMDEMMRYMGPIRRWIFYLKHKEGVL